MNCTAAKTKVMKVSRHGPTTFECNWIIVTQTAHVAEQANATCKSGAHTGILQRVDHVPLYLSTNSPPGKPATPAGEDSPAAAAAAAAPVTVVLGDSTGMPLYETELEYDRDVSLADADEPMTGFTLEVSAGPGTFLEAGSGALMEAALGSLDDSTLLDDIIQEAARDALGLDTVPDHVHGMCKDMLAAPEMPQLLSMWDDMSGAPMIPDMLPFDADLSIDDWDLPLPGMSSGLQPVTGGMLIMSAHSEAGAPVQWQQMAVSSSGVAGSLPPGLQEMLSRFSQQLMSTSMEGFNRKMLAAPQPPAVHPASLVKLAVTAAKKLQATAAEQQK